MLGDLAAIFVNVLIPVLLIVGLGAVVQRYRALHVETMVRLNLYLFVPVFLFVRVYESQMSWREIGGIGLTVIAPMAALGVPLFLALRAAEIPGREIAGWVIGGVFFNAGMFGIPIAELAFGRAGGEVQAIVVMFVNTTMFFAGYVILSLGQGHRGRAALLGYFKLPMIYAITVALVLREFQWPLPPWLDHTTHMIAGGMVPVALATLGAQLTTRARWPRWKRIAPVLLIKLVALPIVTAGVTWLLGLWPWPAAQLILASSAPTAVNTLLLTIELRGDAETAAECVFWTTLFSTVTITVTLAVLLYFGAQPPSG